LKTIERFTLAGDVRVVDVTMQTALLSLQGKKAAKRVGAVFGDTVAELPKNRVAQIQWQQKQLTIWRATHTGEDGFDLLVDAENAEALWGALIDNGVRPVGYNALEILRIEAGLARYGVDMDESNVVTETNLDDAVSYAKGCYVGQEIIARIKYRGHVAKKLSGLEFNQVGKVEDGATLKSMDNKEVGRITSTTYSPLLGRRIALGYLKYDYLNPETSVKTVSGEEEHPAHVTKLPFVHGSAP
jgi:folate-binding protein YgfZ